MAGQPLARLLAGAVPGPSDAATADLRRRVARRLCGEPLQHVLGRWSFRRLELRVDGRALVPRPETEVVAGEALAVLSALDVAGDGRRGGPPVAVDLGTGSGAIACVLVDEHATVRVVAVEVAEEARTLAEENRAALPPAAATRLEVRAGSWYEPLRDLAGAVDLVVSNPPYLAAAEWPVLDDVVREFDPYGALVAGPTGLEGIEAVLAGAPGVLAPGGAVVVELAPDQAGAAVELARCQGARAAEVRRDLAGRLRCLVARW